MVRIYHLQSINGKKGSEGVGTDNAYLSLIIYRTNIHAIYHNQYYVRVGQYVQKLHRVHAPLALNTDVYAVQEHLPHDRMLYLVGDNHCIWVCESRKLAQPQVEDLFPFKPVVGVDSTAGGLQGQTGSCVLWLHAQPQGQAVSPVGDMP